MESGLLITIIIIAAIIVIVPLYFFLRIYFQDAKQKQHSILRNYPVLGKIRYMMEKAGPEFRQYLFNNNNEESHSIEENLNMFIKRQNIMIV